MLCEHSPLLGCTPSLLGWGAPLAISLLLVLAVVCQMSPVPTLEAGYCSWWSSSCSTISCHMAQLSTVKVLEWIWPLSVEGQKLFCEVLQCCLYPIQANSLFRVKNWVYRCSCVGSGIYQTEFSCFGYRFTKIDLW